MKVDAVIFSKNLMSLIRNNNLTFTKVGHDCGICNRSFTDWKYARRSPHFSTVQLLAEYFNVSVESLVNDTSNN